MIKAITGLGVMEMCRAGAVSGYQTLEVVRSVSWLSPTSDAAAARAGSVLAGKSGETLRNGRRIQIKAASQSDSKTSLSCY